MRRVTSDQLTRRVFFTTMLRLIAHRHFSTSSALANRAIVYHSNGNPRSVLSALTFPSLRSPPPNTLNIKYLLAPVNPADINVIEGVYPSRPSPTKLNNDNVFVAGNEGLAEVTGVGSGVSGFENGQWVVMGKQQCGTWRSGANVNVEDVIKVPRGTSEVGAATITVSDRFAVLNLSSDESQVNPATAYNMLSEFVDLKEGDWVIQNGANSAARPSLI
jgi:trans-2-enoyl-CoA reductase